MALPPFPDAAGLTNAQLLVWWDSDDARAWRDWALVVTTEVLSMATEGLSEPDADQILLLKEQVQKAQRLLEGFEEMVEAARVRTGVRLAMEQQVGEVEERLEEETRGQERPEAEESVLGTQKRPFTVVDSDDEMEVDGARDNDKSKGKGYSLDWARNKGKESVSRCLSAPGTGSDRLLAGWTFRAQP